MLFALSASCSSRVLVLLFIIYFFIFYRLTYDAVPVDEEIVASTLPLDLKNLSLRALTYALWSAGPKKKKAKKESKKAVVQDVVPLEGSRKRKSRIEVEEEARAGEKKREEEQKRERGEAKQKKQKITEGETEAEEDADAGIDTNESAKGGSSSKNKGAVSVSKLIAESKEAKKKKTKDKRNETNRTKAAAKKVAELKLTKTSLKKVMEDNESLNEDMASLETTNTELLRRLKEARTEPPAEKVRSAKEIQSSIEMMRMVFEESKLKKQLRNEDREQDVDLDDSYNEKVHTATVRRMDNENTIKEKKCVTAILDLDIDSKISEKKYDVESNKKNHLG